MNTTTCQSVPDLTDRYILVTGGTRRLGLAMSRHLAARGAHLVLQSRCSQSAVEVLATEMGAELVCFELADVDAIRQTIARLGDRLTDIVWSAASFEQIEFTETTVEDWDRIFAANCRSAFFAAQAAKRHCPCLQTLTLFSDAWAKTLGANGLAHGLSKTLIEPLTIALARILAPATRVNAIRPGPILPVEEASDEENCSSITHTLTGRWGEPLEIARAVELLLLNRSMTGSVITVDGGRSSLSISQLI